MSHLPYYITLGLIIACTVIGLRLRFSNSSAPTNVAPWATSAHPLLGHLPAYSPDPVKFLTEQKALVGDVFRVNFVVMKITVLIGAKWNRWLLAEVDEEDVSFYKMLSVLSCGLLDNPLGNASAMAHSRKAMRIVTSEFSRKALDRYFTDWAGQPRISLFDSSSTLLFNANLAVFFGPRFVQDHGPEMISLLQRMQKALLSPWPRILPLWASPSGRTLKRVKERIKQLVDDEVEKRMEDVDHWSGANDYLSGLVMSNEAEGYQEHYYTEHFVTYIMAAHVNSAGTFAWTLLHLLRNPELMRAFEAEIKVNPPLSDIYPIKDMPFSEACLRETGRLYNNLITFRYATRDIRTSSGVVIPKGWVATSPLAVQMDPELFEEPGRWNPRRWLPSCTVKRDLYATRFRNYEFVQFGGGKHVCSGEKLTHALLRATLWPTLVDHFRLELVEEGIVDGEGVDGVGLAPNHAESLGTAFGIREVYVRVTRRDVSLSSVGGA
ncbi:hypothetical protein QFC21_005011 [Naganishia friedmannii]|uniref:Uncharacterized protein n=1 Tax=Naganishia friedmannii TaxID=89922 RepID=A0ACC2VCF0_9TREE|nr:hypothetical protein QFC21_005011 [Naganishia friedmannii]